MKVHHFVNSRYLHMINSDTVKMKEVAQQAGLWDFSWYWWITALRIKIILWRVWLGQQKIIILICPWGDVRQSRLN